jgi:putative tricarboxylic transport membrane protein
MTGDFANVPTDAVVTNWRAVVGPKGMTASQIAYWDAVFAKSLVHDEWARDIAHNLRDGSFLLSADTAKFFILQHEEFRQSLADIGLAK